MLECVVNISEGRDRRLVERIAGDATDVLDIHTDSDHNRSVLTLVGTAAPRRVTLAAVGALDIRDHRGEHPRLGVVDVVPFVAIGDATHDEALAARNEFARWACDALSLPVFLYGPERTLPDIRRSAWATLLPDVGPHQPHPTAGAVCVGVREPLIAYNVLLESNDMNAAKSIAQRVRRPGLRSLAFLVEGRAQVSMNIVDTKSVRVSDAYDAVASEAAASGISIRKAELVGLLLDEHLRANEASRWEQLDIDVTRTVEYRLANRSE